jgi:hypothetical protein
VLEVPTTSGSPEPLEPLLSHKPRSRRYTRQQNAISVNIAPMIDMTFMMLIFFLVTRTIQQPEGTLSSRMPTDRGAIAVALPISPVVVRLASSGPESQECTIRIDGVRVRPDGLPATGRRPGRDPNEARLRRRHADCPGRRRDGPLGSCRQRVERGRAGRVSQHCLQPVSAAA